MAQKYYGEGITIGSSFDLGAARPLDSRSIVATLDDRDGVGLLYKGKEVYVENEERKFILASFNPDGTGKVWHKSLCSADVATSLTDDSDKLVPVSLANTLKVAVDAVNTRVDTLSNEIKDIVALKSIDVGPGLSRTLSGDSARIDLRLDASSGLFIDEDNDLSFGWGEFE